MVRKLERTAPINQLPKTSLRFAIIGCQLGGVDKVSDATHPLSRQEQDDTALQPGSCLVRRSGVRG
jgi:hypothetical protein